MEVLRIAGADSTTPQATFQESNEGAVTTVTPQKEANALTTGPAKVLGSDNARLLVMQYSINELRDLFLSHHGDQRDESGLACEKQPSRRAGTRAAVITNQPASVPGEQR